MRLLSASRIYLLAGLCTLLFTASFLTVRQTGLFSGSAGSAGTLSPNSADVEQIKLIDAYPVFWLGESYKGLPLVGLVHDSSPPVVGTTGVLLNPSVDSVTVLYGECTPDEEGECSPPVQIMSTHACLVAPFASGAVDGEAAVTKAGAVAQMLADGQLRVSSGIAHISIFDMTLDGIDPGEALDSLIPLNESASRLADDGYGPPTVAGDFTGSNCPTSLRPEPVAAGEPPPGVPPISE